MKVRLEFGEHFDAVYVDGKLLDPARSRAVFDHSPDGFAWGYGGSGPSQLALALLLEAGVPDERAVRLHHHFKDAFVGHWTHDGTGDVQEHEIDVEAWVAAQA